MPVSPISTSQPILAQEQLTPLLPLNAGGQPIDLPQATVDAFPQSDLARWARDAQTPRDEAGRIFINRNPEGVAALTGYLRGGQELSTLDADRLMVLATESKALHMGSELDETIEWEQLRRQVGHLTVDEVQKQTACGAAGRPPPPGSETVRAWLRYQDLSAARGEPTDDSAPMRLGHTLAQAVHDHYAPLLKADSKHRRALFFLSWCTAINESARVEYARRLYTVAPHDALAQTNLVVIALQGNEASRAIADFDRNEAAARLAQTLRDLPGTHPHETSDRYAFAQRLQTSPLAVIEAELADPANGDAALEVAGMLRRLQRQHWASRPRIDAGPACPLHMLSPRERAQHQAREAFDREAALLATAMGNLTGLLAPLVAERVLCLGEAVRADAPLAWWQMRLLCRSQLLAWRTKLRDGEDRPRLRDADSDAVQAGYEELWLAYAQGGNANLLAMLTTALAEDAHGLCAPPEVRTMIAAQAARIKAAAALHSADDAAAQGTLQLLMDEQLA